MGYFTFLFSESYMYAHVFPCTHFLQVVELKPGGGDIRVTRENCVQYIHLLAHWRLNVSIERQFRAFREGLASVVPLQWLRLFNQGELQVLALELCSHVHVHIESCTFVYNIIIQCIYSHTSKENWLTKLNGGSLCVRMCYYRC